MVKYLAAAALGIGLAVGISSAQAAPASPASAQVQADTGSAIQKVWHCRRWSGGWGCGGGGHWRWGSRRRW